MPDKVLVMKIENGKMELSEELAKFSIWHDARGNVVFRCHVSPEKCQWSLVATQAVGLHKLVERAINHLKGHPE